MSLTSWLAIYGAVLSTGIAMFQILGFLHNRRFLVVQLHRLWSRETECCELKLSNNGSQKTQLQGIMIGVTYIAENGQILPFSERGVKPTPRSRSWIDEVEELELPHTLQPGESVYVYFDSRMATEILDDVQRTRDIIDPTGVTNLFIMEIEHSQERGERQYYFHINKKYLGSELTLTTPSKFALMRSRVWSVVQEHM